ncbi:glycosyltransferase family 69 protein [Karstenula rhodostoma CBS 690.94]|uniref:Glycosyltransferase family 69 protein n=1 Tax=Karstenula rhodostoma CBS 690.94 TaxID=1392251 RepID=A0A9P4PN24_9PLEO|nr:glycosyltransferase family 69 protein [Karstenula rhodostoma CBS 690.94]
MPSRLRPSAHDYERLPQASADVEDLPARDRRDSNASNGSSRSWLGRLGHSIPGVHKLTDPSVCAHYITPRRRKRSVLRLIYITLFSFPYVCLFLVLVAGIFFPSYTHLPAHYQELRDRALASDAPGRANLHNQKVFIAASIYEHEGELTSGAWGKSVLELVDLLGPHNVHLSIYENDADEMTKESLRAMEKNTTSNSTIVFEDFDLSSLPRITLPNGDSRVKRMTFLAEVRNRALAPLATTEVAFDKVLYLNDVNFDPIDAAQLLFSTNVDANGLTNYGAACAVDFINAFKFYDRFATRDLEGFGMGIPFFPWFTSEGNAESRNDVIAGKDAVRVRSCWGGMTAFEAKWFQDQTRFTSTAPKTEPEPETSANPVLRFRYEEDPFWESSECCLIHADLQYRRSGSVFPQDSGIYMNPYIRVAYDPKTLSWLSFTRRPEKLYSMIHDILNHAMGFPLFNPRQYEEPGQQVTDTVWEYDHPVAAYLPNATESDLTGQYVQVERTTQPASIICVDLVIRQLPGKKNFKIEESNSFLSTGLSLSFGVMIFSALYSMLPSARNYLTKGGLSPKIATLILTVSFLVGALGIAVVSQVLHRFIPHSVVDCDHDHGDGEEGKADDEHACHDHSPASSRPMEEQWNSALENSHSSYGGTDQLHPSFSARRPSLHTQISTKVTQLVTGSKEFCDENGKCFGYSDPCGNECFRNVQHDRVPRFHSASNKIPTRPSGSRSQTLPAERQPLLQSITNLEDVDENSPLPPPVSGPATTDSPHASIPSTNSNGNSNSNGAAYPLHKQPSQTSLASHDSGTSHAHHHHVPTNAFLSIGLQTSIAIALHKIPEGFITYATNHANPRLGVSIFLALFIHNITEGFAMALPLYLAINSRWKAMFWSALLGGVSQPLGAGVAALWFRIAKRRAGQGDGEGEPGDLVYGVMFALTSGIMAMVSLQLLGESLELTHSRKLCFASAFAGMGILGLSSALTA